METIHEIILGDSRELSFIKDNTIDLVVTSPPYPMIEMWDSLFSLLNPKVEKLLKSKKGEDAFKLMHEELSNIWKELYRVLKKGGIVCINIGDATRKIDDKFQLYPNHAEIIRQMTRIGFHVLPLIIWRKPTNSPNKFMGSGMLPPNAYVTLEHEYILIFRKDGMRKIEDEDEKNRRYKSAFFWEERNKWFSDVWTDITGVSQFLNNSETRERSAAFPLELAYRLINMFSIYGDTILDPFLGTGTTILSAMIAGRNSIGIEIDQSLIKTINTKIVQAPEISHSIITQRIANHEEFIKQQVKQGKNKHYYCSSLNFPVKTKQETDIVFYTIKEVIEEVHNKKWKCVYNKYP